MKIIALFLSLLATNAFSQNEIQSGSYGELKIAYNRFLQTVTGYYENYSGWDDETKKPKFSCVFYLEGNVENGKAEITTFFPTEKSTVIIGELISVDSGGIKIKLSEDHGGCWNVRHFSDEFINFKLDKSEKWIYVKYADKDKVYFHSNSNDASVQKTYIVSGDVVYVDRVVNTWYHCTYFGKNKITGWIKEEDLNKL